MSDSIDISANPTNSELVGHVVGAVEAVQDAQRDMVEGVRKLAEHSNDPNAHGITDKNSPFYQAIKEVAGATGKRCTAVVDTMPEGEELAALKESMADDGFLYVKDENGAGGGSGSTSQSLLERIAKLEEEIKKRGVYNDQLIIEESGEFIVPHDGDYEVTCIGGGSGGWVRRYPPYDDIALAGFSGSVTKKIVQLKAGQSITVVIGAGGKGTLHPATQEAGGITSFGDIKSSDNDNSFCGSQKRQSPDLNPKTVLEAYGGGPGGGLNSTGVEDGAKKLNGRWYGAGGGAQYSANLHNAQDFAGDGYQGAVILRFHNPDKDPITATE